MRPHLGRSGRAGPAAAQTARHRGARPDANGPTPRTNGTHDKPPGGGENGRRGAIQRGPAFLTAAESGTSIVCCVGGLGSSSRTL